MFDYEPNTAGNDMRPGFNMTKSNFLKEKKDASDDCANRKIHHCG